MRMEKIREALHQIPELGYQEYKTKRYILSHLQQMHCTIHEVGATALLAYFDLQREKTIAIRCEMDGLPIVEQTGVEYISTHPNTMHACGHDAHMAVIVELGYFLSEHPKECVNNVLLVFQAAEESRGGALEICESGYLEKYQVSMMLGAHIWPTLPEGVMYSRGDALLASSSEVDIQVVGKSVHVAQYDQGIDALVASAELIVLLHEAMHSYQDSVFHIGMCQGGSARNIVASRCCLSGTLRSFDESSRACVIEKIEELVRYIDQKYHTVTSLEIQPCHPVLFNSHALFQKIQSVYPLQECIPYYQSEDFGYYTQHCPTLYTLLGYGDAHTLHSPHYLPQIHLLQIMYEYYKVWITNSL
ncbi:MAG: amidohydrolase [Erysipelotrichaceae bacterium]|nr:amidohydrolase [Erysipelotrichaceae bacterium]